MADYAGIDLGIKLIPDESDLQKRASAARATIQKVLDSKPIRLKIEGAGGGGFGGMNRDITSFTSYLDRANQRVLAFGASIGTLYGAIRIFKDIVSSTILVEKELANINSVLKLSQSGLSSFSQQLFNNARATSTSFEDMAEAATLFSRQGKSAADTLALSAQAATLAKVANLSLADSVQDVTEAIAVFGKSGLSAKQVVDSLSAVSSKFAISAGDLTEGFTRFGAVAQKAGLNFSQVIGLITAAKSTTQRDGAAIGTALTNIFTKLEPRGVVEGLGRIGVAVRDVHGNLLPMIGVVQSLANSYDRLGDSSKAQIDKLVGGARQINILKGALEGLSDANGTYARSQKVVAASADDATRRLQIQNQTLAAMLTNLGTTGKQIGANVGSLSFSPPLKSLIGGVQNNPVTSAFEQADGQATSFGGKAAQAFLTGFGNALLYGAVPLIVKVFGGIIGRTFSTLTRDVSAILNLNGQATQQAQIQEKIVSLYNSGNTALREQLALTTSLAEKTALVGGALAANEARQAVMAAEIGGIASGLTGRGIPHAAGGYLPSMSAESSAIAAGVGGAPSSARPVYLPNVGGGIVANTSEFKVPTAGGTAIFNQTMASQYGLPAGSVSVAAGGFIPPISSVDSSMGNDIPPTLAEFKKLLAADRRRAAAAERRAIKEIQESLQRPEDEAYPAQAIENIRAQMAAGPKVFYGGPGGFTGTPPTVMAANAANSNPRGAAAVGVAEASGFRNPYDYIPGTNIPSTPHLRGSPLPLDYLRLEAANSPKVFYGGQHGMYATPPPYGGPIPPILGAAGQGGFLNTISSPFARNPTLGLAAGLGLPFIGGAISSTLGGPGGNLRSVGVGGVAGSLNGAGTGISIGQFAGPEGAAVGGLIGLVVGGLAGALGKINRSYEDLAEENGKRTDKIKGDLDKVNQVFELQTQLIEAIKSGDNQKIRELSQLQTKALSGVGDQAVKNLIIGGINDPTTYGKATSILTKNAVASSDTTDFTTAFLNARKETSSFSNSFIKNAGGSLVRSIAGAVPGVGPFLSAGLGTLAERKINVPNVNPDVLKNLTSVFGSGISQMSSAELSQFQDFANKNPRGAAQILGSRAGLTDAQLKDLEPSFAERHTAAGGNLDETIKQAISAALKLNADPDLIAEKVEQAKGIASYSEALEKLSGDFATAAKNVATLSEGFQKVSQSINQTVLATSNITEAEKLRLTGSYEQSTITSTFASQRTQAVDQAKSGLTALLSKAGIQDVGTIKSVINASTVGDFQSLLKNQLPTIESKDNDEFKKLLTETVAHLNEISLSEKVSLVVARTTNDLLQIQNSQKEQDTLFKNSRFDPAAFNQINSSSRQGNIIGIGRFSRGNRIQSLLESQQGIDSLGLPQTSDSLDYTQRLEEERTKYSLAAILTQRTGKRVGTSDSELLAAGQSLSANPQREGDTALGSQVVAAVGAKNFSAQAGIDKIKASIGGDQATFNKAVGGTNLGIGDQSLATIANDVGGQGGMVDLLTDIRDVLVNEDYARTLQENVKGLADAIQNLNAVQSKEGAAPADIAAAKNARDAAVAKFNSTRQNFKPSTSAAGPGVTTSTTNGVTTTTDSSGNVVTLPSVGTNAKPEKGSYFSGSGKGFQDTIDRTTQGFSNLYQIGSQVAESLQSRFDGMWSAFSTGTEKARDAFKGFAAGITGDLSKAFANQAFSGLLNGLFNTGNNVSGTPGLLNSLFHANGGPIGLAGGGKVPTMLTGGEFYVGPGAARSIGYDKLAMMNRAGGGMIMGGSGMKDDVSASLSQGSFILKKSAVQRLGPASLQSMVNGHAMGGGIRRADGGGIASPGYSDDLSGSSMDSSGNIVSGGAGDSSGGGSPFTAAQGASAALAVIALLVEKLFQTTYKTLDTQGVVNNAQALAIDQQNNLSGQVAGFHAMKVSNGNGGYSIINEGQPGTTAVEQNFSADGGVIGPMTPLSSPASSMGGGASVAVTVHNYAGGGTSSSVTGKGNDTQSKAFMEQLGKAVRDTVNDQLVQQSRQGGFFSQNKRYTPNNQIT